MRVWKVVLLLDLAIVLAVGWGWTVWGRRAAALDAEIARTRSETERLERELAAARGGGPARAGEQQWVVRGVVRAVLPDRQVIVLTHEEIPGYMPSMTMGFREASSKIHESVQIGDAVRFTLRGTPPDVVVTAMEKMPERASR
jgi:Cu/Ag efflux protein CusF